MGLLDNPDVALALAAGLFNVKKGDAMGGIGNAILNAQQFASQSQRQKTQDELAKQQLEQHRMQMQQFMQQRAIQDQLRTAASQAFAPGSQPQGPMPDGGNLPAVPGGGGMPDFVNRAMAIDPMEGMKYQGMLAKESPFGKVDPKDFTTESIQRFIAEGGRNYALLQPRVKMEAVNTGGQTQFVNPYSPGGPIAHSLSPADQQRIPIERAGLGIRVAEARDQGVALPPGIGGGFITGNSPGVAPRAPQGTQGVPQAPQGISPKQQREIAAERAKDLPQAMGSYQNAASNLDALANAAKSLKEHPGLAGISGGMSMFPNTPGSNAANAAADLESLKAKVAFGALQAMRDASKTGGALGSVSDAEGKRLENSIAALEKSQSVKQFRENLAKIEAYAKNAKMRLSSTMKQTYGEGFAAQADPLGLR